MGDQVDMFMGVTGTDEETARQILDAHNGDLNNAINFFLEHGAQAPAPSIAQPPSQPALADPNSDEEEPSEPLVRHRRSRPSETHAETSAGPFIAPGTLPPNIVQGSAVPSGGGITRFESPFDAEEEPPAFQRFGSSIQERDAGGANQGQPGRDAAVGVGGPVNDHNDVEEEMMRAALEASMKEHGGGPVADDEDLEKAISQSLRTAEQEQTRLPPPDLLAEVGSELFPPAAAPRVGPLNGSSYGNGVSARGGVRDVPIEGFEDDEDQGGSGQARKSSKKSSSPSPNGRGAGAGPSRGSRRASPSPEPPSGREGRHASRSSRRRPSSEERAAELMEDVQAFMGAAGAIGGGNRPGPNRQPPPVGSWPPRFPARDSDGNDEPTPAEARVAAARAAALGGAGPAEELDPLEGFTAEEREEARMLEAAMMGIPYEARPGHPGPAFNPAAGPAYRPAVPEGGYEDMDLDDEYGRYRPPRELDPMVQAQRDIRNQQDEEYLASLAADREKSLKAAAEAAEKARADREARRQREEELERAAREERERLEAEEALQVHLAEKASTLPEEPPVGEPGVVTVMVRMPDGSRKARRLRSSDPVQVLFDSIDVENSFKPGSYRLINSFPRRVLEAKACAGKTLQDVGLTSKQEALFLEQ